MRYSTTTALVLAVLSIGEAVAGPTHAYLHRRRDVHAKKDLAHVNWKDTHLYDNVDFVQAYADGQKKNAAPKVADSAAVSKEKTTPSSQGIDDLVEDLWEGLVGASNLRTSLGEPRVLGGGTAGGIGLAGDFQNGNIGNPYGSNMVKVNSSTGFDFTATFVNTQSKRISINIWNKGGPDGQPLSGASLASKNTSLTFSLKSGATQIVAFADKSYVAWAEPCEQRSFEGSFATTWGEAKFQRDGSGYDVSAIKNANGNDYKMEISSAEVGCVSDQTQNMWLTPTQPVGGSDGSCYVPGSMMHLTVKMGGRS